MKKGYAYDDILISPKRSRLDSRQEVDVTIPLFEDFELEKPVISANMSTVTESEMADSMAKKGGVGIIHRFIDVEEQAREIQKVDGKCGGCVGVDEDYVTNVSKLLEAGADFICVDVAHGHLEKCLEAVSIIREEYPQLNLMAGNVATKQGVMDLFEQGADCVKVGIGGGSMCETRRVAGIGVPQATAVMEGYEAKKIFSENHPDRHFYIVADGGIKRPGDAVKALVLGADSVMIGGMFASCRESSAEVVTRGGEEYKICYGMASKKAREERDSESRGAAVEGDSGMKKVDGSVEEKMESLAKGIRSGFSYCGCMNIDEVRKKVGEDDIVEVTNSTINRNGAFGVK